MTQTPDRRQDRSGRVVSLRRQNSTRLRVSGGGVPATPPVIVRRPSTQLRARRSLRRPAPPITPFPRVHRSTTRQGHRRREPALPLLGPMSRGGHQRTPLRCSEIRGHRPGRHTRECRSAASWVTVPAAQLRLSPTPPEAPRFAHPTTYSPSRGSPVRHHHMPFARHGQLPHHTRSLQHATKSSGYILTAGHPRRGPGAVLWIGGSGCATVNGVGA